MASRIKIKMGELEIEFEGNENFLKNELLDFVKKMSNLSDTPETSVAKPVVKRAPASRAKRKVAKKAAAPKKKAVPKKVVVAAKPAAKKSAGGAKRKVRGPIIGKMKIETGKDLILAACGYLTLKQGVETFGRREVLQEIKKETGYYKKSYNTNLAAYLKQLVKDGKLEERSKNNYALMEKTKAELKPLLA